LARGERLGEIAFSPDALEDYGTSLKDKVPAGLLVERLRRQFDDT
jgi:hypothetical protein